MPEGSGALFAPINTLLIEREDLFESRRGLCGRGELLLLECRAHIIGVGGLFLLCCCKSFLSISYNIQLTPQKLSAERRNRTGAEGYPDPGEVLTDDVCGLVGGGGGGRR